MHAIISIGFKHWDSRSSLCCCCWWMLEKEAFITIRRDVIVAHSATRWNAPVVIWATLLGGSKVLNPVKVLIRRQSDFLNKRNKNKLFFSNNKKEFRGCIIKQQVAECPVCATYFPPVPSCVCCSYGRWSFREKKLQQISFVVIGFSPLWPNANPIDWYFSFTHPAIFSSPVTTIVHLPWWSCCHFIYQMMIKKRKW